MHFFYNNNKVFKENGQDFGNSCVKRLLFEMTVCGIVKANARYNIDNSSLYWIFGAFLAVFENPKPKNIKIMHHASGFIGFPKNEKTGLLQCIF